MTGTGTTDHNLIARLIDLQSQITSTTGSAVTRHTYTQSTAATVWSISHSLGGYPEVQVMDSSGNRVLCDVSFPDTATITCTFSTAMTGTVIYL